MVSHLSTRQHLRKVQQRWRKRAVEMRLTVEHGTGERMRGEMKRGGGKEENG